MNPDIRKKRFLRLCEKLDILGRLDRGESREEITRMYSITLRTVSRIRRTRQKILEYSKLPGSLETLNSKSIKSTSVSNLELYMYKWFMDKKNTGIMVTGPEIQEEALRANRDLGGSADFKASTGWLQRFKKRHGIKMINLQGVGLNLTDIKVAKDFCDELEKSIQENNYKPENIYNVVRNGLQWTNIHQDIENSGALRILKDRVPLVLGVNSDGSHRLRVLVSGRVQNPRSFGNRQLPVKYVFHGNGYPGDLLIAQWFSEVFLPEIKKRRGESREKILLVMDTAPTPSMMHQVQVNFLCIPPEAMPFVQPLYQGVFERFRNLYKQAFMDGMVVQEDGKKFALDRKWTIWDCCCAIAGAWDSFTRQDFQMAWRKLMKIDQLDDRNNQVLFFSCGVTEKPDVDDENELEESSWSSSDVRDFENSAQRDMKTEENFDTSLEYKNIIPLESVHPNCDTKSSSNQLDIEETILREAMKQLEEIPSKNEALKAVTTIFKWANNQEDATKNDIWDIVKLRLMILQKKKLE